MPLLASDQDNRAGAGFFWGNFIILFLHKTPAAMRTPFYVRAGASSGCSAFAICECKLAKHEMPLLASDQDNRTGAGFFLGEDNFISA